MGRTEIAFESHMKIIGPTQLLNGQWHSSGIDDCQMLKYQSSEP